jgi:hypothetical protein
MIMGIYTWINISKRRRRLLSLTQDVMKLCGSAKFQRRSNNCLAFGSIKFEDYPKEDFKPIHTSHPLLVEK